MDGIVGRDDARAIVAQFVATAAARPAALAIEGAPGIGKTALLRHAIGVATAAGVRVLRTSPGEQDMQLTFTGLTDLLRSVEPERLSALATPQRMAIAAATLREPGGPEPPDERAIGTGLATVLTGLATDGPLLVAIDDVQWLDPSSERALRFALRRVAGPVGLLTCRRSSSERADLAEGLGDDAWQHRLHLDGLSVAATFVLVRERLGVALPRTRLNRVWEVSQGNALLVLELVRAASDHHLDELLGGQLPLPERLERLLSHRLSALSDDALQACLAVACAGRASIELFRELDLESGLAGAEAAGVLLVRPDRVRFSHPLLATGTLARVSDPESRRMHGLLAEVVVAAEARARHLALADPCPSAATAIALDAAAAEALQRGSIATAVELGRLAVERTPSGDVADLWSRKIALATTLFAAGESAAAAEQLADRAESCPPGRLRAEAGLLMVEVEYATSTVFSAAAVAREAAIHAGDDRRLRARALLSLAAVDPQPHDTANLISEARRCLDELDPPDDVASGWAMALESGRRIITGEPTDPAEIHAAVDIERTGRMWRSSDYAASVRPVQLRWIDEAEAGLVALAELEQRAEQEGNEGSIPYVLGHRVTCLLALARFREAGDAAHRHLEHAEATGQEGQRVQALYLVGCAEAYLGDLPVARAAAEAAFTAIERWDEPWMLAAASGICGVIALSLGEPERARAYLDRWRVELHRAGITGPPISPFDVDHVEALLGCQDRVAAGVVTDDLVALADRAARRSAQAAGQHCRALLAAYDGDLHQALGYLDTALAFDAKALNDFARGRVLVLQGVLRRRLKQKAAARSSLETARRLFQATGSAHWIAVADSELARLGQRRGDGLTLTDTERRVAELASQGMTNREVAERAFVSPKTVEANLARVYRKLGIRSRAELGALMAVQSRSET